MNRTGGKRTITKGKAKSATQKQIVDAAAQRHGVPTWLLWGVFGAENSWSISNGVPFGLIETNYPQLNGGKGRTFKNQSSLPEAADIAAELLASLKHEHGSWGGAVSAYSGGEYTLSHPRELSNSSTGKAAETKLASFGPQDLLPGGLGLSLLEELGIHIPNPEGPLTEAEKKALEGGNPIQGVENAVGSLEGTAQFLNDAAKLLFTPEGWLQIGQVVTGVVLIGWGVHHIIQTASGVNPTRGVTHVAAKAAEVAAVVK